MDTDRILELVPHYAAMLVVVFLVIGAVEALVGDVSFWLELGIIVVVVALYRPAVLYLGVAPSQWE